MVELAPTTPPKWHWTPLTAPKRVILSRTCPGSWVGRPVSYNTTPLLLRTRLQLRSRRRHERVPHGHRGLASPSVCLCGRIPVPKVRGGRPRWVCGAHRRVLRLNLAGGRRKCGRIQQRIAYFVDLAAGADVELALRREEKRPKVIGRHSTSLRAAVVYTCIWRVRSIKFIRRTIRFAFSSLLQRQAH